SSLSSHSPSLTLLPPPPRSPLFPYTTLFRSTLMPGPSLADVGYFTLPVFAFAALLVLATDGSRSEPGDAEALPRGRSPWVLALDGLIVVGALFNITWSTALGPVVHAGAPTPLAFAVTIGYPVTDLILVVMVILLLGTYR